MKIEPSLDRCLTYIGCEIQAPFRKPGEGRRFRAITISRQCGAGAHSIAERLAATMQAHEPPDSPPWTIFDRNLVEKVLEDHNLPIRLARYMPEDRISEISDTMDQLFGLHPPSWNIVRQFSETIIHLAHRGNVIIIGRAANVVTRNLNSALHVRLIGSPEKRSANLQEVHGLTPSAALDLLRREDRGRARYLKKHFDANIEDPLLYHLILNTDLLTYDETADIISRLALSPAGALA